MIGASGSILWSLGNSSACLWDAYDGTYLGQIRETSAMDGWDEEDTFYRIDPSRVSATRAFAPGILTSRACCACNM